MAGFDAAELARRRAYIVAEGLPCKVVGIMMETDFASLVLEPLEGWTHLVPDDELPAFAALGWTYHVSLGYGIDDELLKKIDADWAGRHTTVMVDYILESNVAMLRWGDGLGGDALLWAALAQGYPHRSFGLHLSM